MHPELKRRWNDEVLGEAALRFGLEPAALTRLAAFENFVYEGTNQDGVDIILRISHSLRRTVDYTRGEVEFVRYLAAGKLPVSPPVLAESGTFVETIDVGEPGHCFVATAFERAPGHVFDDAPPLKEKFWKPALFRDLGFLFAELHERARSYRPTSAAITRQQWHEYDVVDVDRFVPRDERLVRERTAAVVTRLRRLPSSPEGYGLIHADLHPHNFCFDEGRVTVFDFDNCEYAWFVKDIAVILFYVAREVSGAEREEVAVSFLQPFLQGYRERRPCERAWLEVVPDLLSLQRSMNYALFHQYRESGPPDEAAADAWRRFRRDIEADKPVLALDFTRF